MPASRIDSVDLNKDGSVTIHGTFPDMTNRKVTLLHIWVAQQGAGVEGGVGLAIDALDKQNTHDARGNNALKETDKFGCASFEVMAFAAGDTAGDTAGDGADQPKFRPGPATVSAIAVVSPMNSSAGAAEVLEWSRMLTLPEYGQTEAREAIP
jgi:hypothetical protein